jgi:hypothetical protein
MLVEQFCDNDDLSTYDPYDLWKTRLGYTVKDLYNRSRWYCILAAPLAAGDLLNDGWRLFYTRQEYPIVRAFAALSLMNIYERHGGEHLLAAARGHLDWLVENRSPGYKGYGWGLGFPHAVSRTVKYAPSTPFSTITVYPLEAFVRFTRLAGGSPFPDVLDGFYRFFDEEIQLMYEDDQALATSYGPFCDRVVHNAVSYTMYAYSLLLPWAPPQRQTYISARVAKLFRYLQRAQRPDGSWMYSPEGSSFIDCFHSCIVLKNLIKTSGTVALDRCPEVVSRGYEYLKRTLLDQRHFLLRRFAVRNKPGLVKFDLYDNAEMLNLALLLGDTQFAQRLQVSIIRHFCEGLIIYSQIDLLGVRRGRNMLRWAVMPFLYAASQTV